ncbi:MAG: hypothetical protein GXY36_14785 [Chloroflexi bacterium]|jgi:hypothetical protein|nr:hypothetical protein [Chloroflexota bacterium]
MMTLPKREFEEVMEARLEQLELELDRLVDGRSEGIGDGSAFQREIEALQDMYQTARNHLQDLKEADEENWQDHKPAVEEATERLTEAIERVSAR